MERNAYICTAKGCDPPYRTFVRESDAIPPCPQHGVGKMTRQMDQPYMQGEKTGKPKRVKPRRPAAEG